MKFIVSRTSDFEGETSPCEEAYRDKYIRTDTRNIDDPTKISMYYNKPEEAKKDWYGRGTNHRVVNGYIKRDFEDEAWFIELNSLEEIIDFTKKKGQIVLRDSWESDEFQEIEIYDDWRE